MMKVNFNEVGGKIHFIGVGGVSMSGLAKHLNQMQFKVSGSDINCNNFNGLTDCGIQCYCGHNKDNIKDCSEVVYTSAISEDNEEYLEAIKQGIPLIKRSALLGQIISEYKNSIGICGSHGKTTATAMLSHVMISANKNPTVFLGGNDKTFGNYLSGGKDYIIAETCEYKKNLLDMPVKVGVVLNIDNDHLDCYSNMKDMINTFAQYTKNSIVFINADDANAKMISNNQTITFGIQNLACFMAKHIKYNGRGYSFTAYAYGIKLGRIKLKVAGIHNIYNALSVIATASYFNIPFSHQKKALEGFCGVERRNEYLGKVGDMDIYADYAHHPKEISATLNAFCQCDQDFITIFQPHTYSRTKLLMQDFVEVLSSINNLVIMDTYPAREEFDKQGSANTLYKNLIKDNKKQVYFVKNYKQLKSIINNKKDVYKKALFLGAGDIYDMAKNLIKESGSKKKNKI